MKWAIVPLHELSSYCQPILSTTKTTHTHNRKIQANLLMNTTVNDGQDYAMSPIDITPLTQDRQDALQETEGGPANMGETVPEGQHGRVNAHTRPRHDTQRDDLQEMATNRGGATEDITSNPSGDTPNTPGKSDRKRIPIRTTGTFLDKLSPPHSTQGTNPFADDERTVPLRTNIRTAAARKAYSGYAPSKDEGTATTYNSGRSAEDSTSGSALNGRSSTKAHGAQSTASESRRHSRENSRNRDTASRFDSAHGRIKREISAPRGTTPHDTPITMAPQDATSSTRKRVQAPTSEPDQSGDTIKRTKSPIPEVLLEEEQRKELKIATTDRILYTPHDLQRLQTSIEDYIKKSQWSIYDRIQRSLRATLAKTNRDISRILTLLERQREDYRHDHRDRR